MSKVALNFSLIKDWLYMVTSFHTVWKERKKEEEPQKGKKLMNSVR